MSLVVVGAAVVRDGRLLAAQRAEPPELRGGWEFPGGKVDPGESDREALIRECREELGVLVTLGAQVGGDWPLSGAYVLRVWIAEIASGEPEAKEHLELRWLAPDELFQVPWLPADLPIVRAVADFLAASSPGQD
ncbi:8-oxo-dGTP diphosphatase [Thermocatellispora tengchongensis]|uniref:8-oxo-dGTP diphosphatase n=1 Tax=Thermocatellispora tengchongensis TaxID=1073253 RepID=A0A840P985_9ACTN|nr:(deoxy)nucleoside triphosphate pyrophosphohydrolase [Thermocatellispora tengchongensis]MBB5134000.1 8-oxo-dGTP diphosphatase [Thermocatellispora tengchongensis]